ncbi:MAG: primosomal protein N', partial [Nitrospinota bacterium]|nr:primosomal protein N' [Nitrospinota bacterium]
MIPSETEKPPEVLSAEIAVFVPLRQTFFYSFTKVDEPKLLPGVRVVVPFRNRDMVGVFLRFKKTDIKTKSVKTVLDDKPIFSEKVVELAEWTALYYLCGAGEVFKMISPREELKSRIVVSRSGSLPERSKGGIIELHEILKKPLSIQTLSKKLGMTASETEKHIKPHLKKGFLTRSEEFYFTVSSDTSKRKFNPPSVSLRAVKEFTAEQLDAIESISAEIEKRAGTTTLLFGATGSGKTEVYMELCKRAISNGGGAIVLVPEIALTYQLVRRFESKFGISIAILHSGLSPAQRREEWMRVARGEAKVVIGARSAVFAPIDDLRLIVVDEENDGSYKQSEHPYYNARDVAVMRGKMSGAAVVLGSATPSIESFYNASEGKYRICRMPHRIDKTPFPKTTLVNSDPDDKRLLPANVVENIIKRKERNEQVLIFVNRRGDSRYLKCNTCNAFVLCPNCSITLTHHSAGGKGLLCHYCGYSLSKPGTCSECGAGKTFSYRGVGTQKVEAYLKELFPKLKVDRLDQDTAPTRDKTFEILKRFEENETDILVGTQMVAKGHDFRNLTFTAIAGADDYLAFPDFRSAERTFSLITQAAGRTGRGGDTGEVMVSSTSGHYAINHALNHDYESFYNEEIEKRRITGYPPFARIIGLRFESTSEEGKKR